jgi:predicted RNA-binding Zn ribbon-like protein
MREALHEQRVPPPGTLSWLNGRLASSVQRWRLEATGSGVTSRVEPLRADWSAVTAALVLSFNQLMSVSDLSRLKKCANPDCSYLFYDDSTNSSRRWCFANVCGNMMHVRAFRARRIREASS